MVKNSQEGFIFQFDNSFPDKAEEYDFIKIWQISEYSIEPDREIVEHVQYCNEITYIISGKGTFYNGDEQVTLQQGDIHVIGKDISHRIVPEERSNLRFANIGFEFADNIDESLLDIGQLPVGAHEPLQGPHMLSPDPDGQIDAGVECLPVDDNGTGTALTHLAALFDGCHAIFVA